MNSVEEPDSIASTPHDQGTPEPPTLPTISPTTIPAILPATGPIQAVAAAAEESAIPTTTAMSAPVEMQIDPVLLAMDRIVAASPPPDDPTETASTKTSIEDGEIDETVHDGDTKDTGGAEKRQDVQPEGESSSNGVKGASVGATAGVSEKKAAPTWDTQPTPKSPSLASKSPIPTATASSKAVSQIKDVVAKADEELPTADVIMKDVATVKEEGEMQVDPSAPEPEPGRVRVEGAEEGEVIVEVSSTAQSTDPGMPLNSHSAPSLRDAKPYPASPPASAAAPNGATDMSAGTGGVDRPLNVSDALSYLDAVKVQFSHNPGVYNKFLDIMKEFKGMMIDTPGVIRRVTYLFDGHPSLIQGFNTFLPAGYRIECTTDSQTDSSQLPVEGYASNVDGSGAGYLTVTTPSGTTRHRMGTGAGMSDMPLFEPRGVDFGGPPGPGTPGAGPASALLGFTASSTMHSGVLTPAAPGAGTPGAGGSGLQSEAIEPAVQYVQKIKQRCDAETYKQFLDILGRYHAAPGVMDEREVSLQIAQLFKDAPDLRSDFRIFMPPKTQKFLDDESLWPGGIGGVGGMEAAMRMNALGVSDSKGKRKPTMEAAAGSASVPSKRKRRTSEREREREQRDREPLQPRERGREGREPKDIIGKTNSRGKHDYPGRRSPPPSGVPAAGKRTSHHIQSVPIHPHEHHHGPQQWTGRSAHQPGISPTGGVGIGVGTMGGGEGINSGNGDYSDFFDRVKRSLDSRETYNEFLKLINLYTQEYIDTRRLIKEARNYLGDSSTEGMMDGVMAGRVGGGGELMRTLKAIVGWDEKKEREMWMEEVSVNVVGVGMTGGGKGSGSVEWARPVVVERTRGVISGEREPLNDGERGESSKPKEKKPIPGRVDLSVRYGSYRRLPAAEINTVCSGRDEMCRSVLNDEWVSHPTYGSEDSSPIFKKNVYEEALHRSEEERHEYDFHIDAISKMINLLEPINNKILSMQPEERGNFKLKPNLGGAAKSIHFRVVKKIYGRDVGLEVIQAMQDTPGQAIPIVFMRLKQKEEEWKRAQREWNKVWREVDARNYQKSLDYQSTNFKANDKKALTTKALVNQIEAAREEQMAKRASLIDPLFSRTRPRHQMEFVIGDMKVLQDALKLVFSFLDRTQGQINHTERRKVETFLRSFVVLFFGLDPVAFNAGFVLGGEGASGGSGAGDGASEVGDDAGSVEDVEVASVTSGGSRGRGSKKGGSVGDLRKKLLKGEQAKRKTRGGQDKDGSRTPSISRLASPAPADEEKLAADATARKAARKSIFFTNTTFYVLVRLLETLYSRLALFKETAAKLAAEPPATRRPNTVAKELGIDVHRPLLPGSVEHYYDVLLESCERLFDAELEQHFFEEQTRAMFGTKVAYKIFTVDKLIGAIIKQVQAVFTDPCQELLENLKRDRAIPTPTTQDMLNSRRNAERIVGPDENLFRIDWLPDCKTITVQLLGKDDSSFDDSEVLTGRWQAYLDSFVSSDATEGVPKNKMRMPFLRRNARRPADMPPPDMQGRGGMQIKVCTRTYRLFFVAGSEDVLIKSRTKADITSLISKLEAGAKRRRKWLDSLEV
ncbi:Transcriptional regulatory protein sin3 [Pleurotus pulmonarius]|nr:Transcriptional regulatory protein sin3 [Pleurotus pulmonarius]